MTLPSAASSICFQRASRRQPAPAVDATALTAATAQALADALPFLRCGEESAIHAFGCRLARAGDNAEAQALATIADDERRHADWLAALAAGLPAPGPITPAAVLSAFFRRLLTRDKALHFARIAALDLAVCELLRPLASRAGMLAVAPQIVAGFQAIRQDEARHVRIARQCAARLGGLDFDQRAIDAAMRDDLCRLLAPLQDRLRRLGVTGFAARPAPAHVD